MIFRIALRNLLRNKRRTLLTTAAVTVGIWSALSLSTLARGASAQIAENAILNLLGHAQLHAAGYRDDPAAERSMPYPRGELAAFLAGPGIRAWTARVRIPAVINSERESAGVTLFGVQPTEERAISFVGSMPVDGRMIESEDEEGIVIGAKLAEKLKTQVGRRLVIIAQDAKNRVVDRGAKVVGLFHSELESTELHVVFAGRRTMQRFLEMGGDVSEIALSVRDRDGLPDVLKALRERSPGIDVASWDEIEPLAAAVRSVQDGALRLWTTIVVTAVCFGLVNSLLMAVFERTKELGLLHALGMRSNSIVALILAESVAMLVIGALLGNAGALLTAAAFRGGLDLSSFKSGTEMARIGRVIYPQIHLPDWLMSNGLLFAISVVASLYPAWRATRQSPIAALNRG